MLVRGSEGRSTMLRRVRRAKLDDFVASIRRDEERHEADLKDELLMSQEGKRWRRPTPDATTTAFDAPHPVVFFCGREKKIAKTFEALLEDLRASR